MKKLRFLLPLCALCLFFSCKKSSSSTGGSGSITATIDGSSQTFNFSATASLLSVAGMQALTITGVQSSSSSTYVITLIITPASGNVTAGTYTATAASDNVQLTYIQASTSLAYQDDPTSGSSNASVTISSISSTHVKGTFSGKLILESGSGAATKTVTNGSFDLDIK